MTSTFERIVQQRRRAYDVLTHLPEEQPLTVLDLLDALATLHLRLEPDAIGYAAEAYRAEVATPQ